MEFMEYYHAKQFFIVNSNINITSQGSLHT